MTASTHGVCQGRCCVASKALSERPSAFAGSLGMPALQMFPPGASSRSQPRCSAVRSWSHVQRTHGSALVSSQVSPAFGSHSGHQMGVKNPSGESIPGH